MKQFVKFASAALILATNAAFAIPLPTRTTVTEVNDSGLPISVGDVFPGLATFDPADLPENGFLPLDEAGRDLFLDFGDFSFDASDAVGFGFGFPAFYTENGRILGLDMSATVPASSVLGGLNFEGGVFDSRVLFLDPTTGATIVEGDFQVKPFQAIPLPGTLVLLASSIIAVAWTRRRAVIW